MDNTGYGSKYLLNEELQKLFRDMDESKPKFFSGYKPQYYFKEMSNSGIQTGHIRRNCESTKSNK